MPSPERISREEVLNRYFRAADVGDTGGMVECLDPDVEVLFANEPAIRGTGKLVQLALETTVQLKGARHKVQTFHHDPTRNDVVVVLFVEFHRLDERVVTLPAVGIARFNAAGRIDRYQVYADLAPVWA